MGGAISSFGGTLIINNSTFNNNRSSGESGAIDNFSFATLIITNSTFSNNRAGTNGGAISNISSSDVTIINSTFANNSSGGTNQGGAIYNASSLTIIGSIFTTNSALSGGAIFNTAIGAVSTQESHYQDNTCSGTITDNGGNTVTNATGCPGSAPIPLDVSAIACNGDNAEFTINNGDANFNITGTGAGLPLSNIGTGIVSLTGAGSWTEVTATERRGDRQFIDLGDITCPATVPLSASATCIGADLQVNIFTGDTPFDIVDDSATLRDDVPMGAILVPGPITVTNLRVVEQSGDGEIFPFGDFDCFISETLSASVVCNGANLDVIIANGNAPFTIDVNGSITSANPLGIYNFAGPNTFTVIVCEESGDGEQFTTSVTCDATVIPPVVPPVAPILSPDPTALGCELTTSINLANAPDNTYCRVLMRNGGVVSYSGAIPADLISLGVILAVDVYRLEGGMSINTFPDYARVCLSGPGRLFYMDSRNAPRVSIELASENVDGLTCGWIPAPGTLILTN